MATEKQIEANRQNAQKSTGPKTEQGKENTGANALKHGLFSTSPVITNPRFNESQEEYDLLKESLTQELKPSSTLQTHLVQKIVDSLWRYRRLINSEKSSIQQAANPNDQDAFWAMIEEAKFKHHLKSPDASESDKEAYNEYVANRKDEPPAESASVPSGADSLTFGRYESRLDRQLHRSFRMLRLLKCLESPKPRQRRQK